MNACTRPLSWLLLERYQLGEVDATERARVDEHLAACPICRADLGVITADERRLPALPEPVPARSWSRFGLALATASAAAGLVGLLVAGWALWPVADPGIELPARIQIKGGELALVLVRARQGALVEDPIDYASGDRFRIELTCPPGQVAWEAVVFQTGQAHFPYPPGQALACGNRVALPGAFQLTGSGPVVVCVAIGAELPSRAQLADQGLLALPAVSVCASLRSDEPR